MKRDTIRGPNTKGGTGLINVEFKLRALKLQWLRKYTQKEGIWKNLFDYWIGRVSGDDKLGWFILNNTKRISPGTPSFYRDVINAFRKSGGSVQIDFSCINETHCTPLWNNSVITVGGTLLDSKILKKYGIINLRHVVKDQHFISFKELSKRCNLRNINAGRILARLRKGIIEQFVKENREGPANHLCKSLYINLEGTQWLISKVSVKNIYCSLISTAFIPPQAQMKWQIKLKTSRKLNWDEIWHKACNIILEHSDKDLWFRLRNRILPTKDKLLKMGKVEDDKCGLCKTEIENSGTSLYLL